MDGNLPHRTIIPLLVQLTHLKTIISVTQGTWIASHYYLVVLQTLDTYVILSTSRHGIQLSLLHLALSPSQAGLQEIDFNSRNTWKNLRINLSFFHNKFSYLQQEHLCFCCYYCYLFPAVICSGCYQEINSDRMAKRISHKIWRFLAGSHWVLPVQ